MGILADSAGVGIKRNVGIAGLGQVNYGFRNDAHDVLPLNYNPDRDQVDVNNDICANSNGRSGNYGCGYIFDYNNITNAFNTGGNVAPTVVNTVQNVNPVIESSIEGWNKTPIRTIQPQAVQQYRPEPISRPAYVAPTPVYEAPISDVLEYAKETSVSASRDRCSNYVAPLKSNKQYYTFKVLGSTSAYSKPNGQDIDTLKSGTKVTGYYDADGWIRVSGVIDSRGWKKYCKTGYIRSSDLKAIMKKRQLASSSRVSYAKAPVVRKKPKCVRPQKAHYYNKRYNTQNFNKAKVEDFSLSAN